MLIIDFKRVDMKFNRRPTTSIGGGLFAGLNYRRKRVLFAPIAKGVDFH